LFEHIAVGESSPRNQETALLSKHNEFEQSGDKFGNTLAPVESMYDLEHQKIIKELGKEPDLVKGSMNI
jgi:hypothetical protein